VRAYDGAGVHLSTRLADKAAPAQEIAMTDRRDEKAERLAAALRENLKRRKAQARAADAGHIERKSSNDER